MDHKVHLVCRKLLVDVDDVVDRSYYVRRCHIPHVLGSVLNSGLEWAVILGTIVVEHAAVDPLGLLSR